MSVQLKSVWGSTLYHINDLPFNPKEWYPDVYTKFQKMNIPTKIRPLLDTPGAGDLPFPENPNASVKTGINFMPNLKDLIINS